MFCRHLGVLHFWVGAAMVYAVGAQADSFDASRDQAHNLLISKEYSAAEAQYDAMLQPSSAAQPNATTALALGGLGLAQFYQLKWDEADTSFVKSAEIATDTGSQGVLARSLFNLGLLRVNRDSRRGQLTGVPLAASSPPKNARRQFRGRYAFRTAGPLKLFESAATNAEDAGLATLAVRAHLESANYMRRSGSGDPRAPLKKALDGLRAVQDWSVRASLAAAIIGSANQAHMSKSAFRSFGAKVVKRVQLDKLDLLSPAAKMRASGALAIIARRGGQLDVAEGHALNAIFYSETAHEYGDLYRWYALLADIADARGNRGPKIAAYQHAVSELSAIRSDLPIVDPLTNESIFRSDIAPIYLGLAEAYLAGASTQQIALDQFELIRTAVEGLREAELSEYYHREECVLEAIGPTIDVLSLEDRSAILYPILLGDRLELLVSIGGNIERHTLKGLDFDALTQKVQSLTSKISDPRNRSNDYLPIARELYTLLIKPLEPGLRASQVNTLVMVPDGPLRGLPLGVLHDGTSFLIEKYSVAVVPGLDLTSAKQENTSANPRVLLASFTTRKKLKDERRAFPELRHVEGELTAIAAQFGSTADRTIEFSGAELEAQLAANNYSVVHIASHAKFSPAEDGSFILARDGKFSISRLEKAVQRTQVSGTPIDLLVLSACETAVGTDSGSKAALGLAGVAVRAGARSVLATLWSVNDASTAKAIPDFYKHHFSEGQSKAESLAQAQRTLIASGSHAHPYYWAPFALIGNWQ